MGDSEGAVDDGLRELRNQGVLRQEPQVADRAAVAFSRPVLSRLAALSRASSRRRARGAPEEIRALGQSFDFGGDAFLDVFPRVIA